MRLLFLVALGLVLVGCARDSRPTARRRAAVQDSAPGTAVMATKQARVE